MEKNIPKSKVRDNLKNIPETLFNRDPNQEVKIFLLQGQCKKHPNEVISLIKKMLSN